MRVPASVRIDPNQYPVRLELIDGTAKWRGVKDFDHASLCRAFGLDQATFYFDLPSSIRGTGSSLSGYGGNRGNRVINGYVMRAGLDKPWGKLTIIKEGDQIRDDDPNDMKDFYNLSRTDRR